MTRHYSTRDFFRQMPNALLASYFSARAGLTDFAFTAIKETRIDALFDAWMELPEAARVRLETELREICDIACAVGTQAILDEAEFHLDDDKLAELRDGLMALPGYHERAMTVFLEHPNLWRGATRFHHADTLSYWRKRKNLPRVAAAVDSESLRSLDASHRRPDPPHQRRNQAPQGTSRRYHRRRGVGPGGCAHVCHCQRRQHAQ